MDIRKFWREKRSKTEVFDLKLLVFTLIFDIAKPAFQRVWSAGTYRKAVRIKFRNTPSIRRPYKRGSF